MKKFFYTLSLALILTVSVLGFAGCTGSYTVDPTKLVGVWEVIEDGNVTEITRIEFKNPLEEDGDGTFSYYTSGATAYFGTWKARNDGKYNLMFEENIYTQPPIASLEDGELYIEFYVADGEMTNRYRKISD